MIRDPDRPSVYTLEPGDAEQRVAEILAETPYTTVGELRDAVDADTCCHGCHDHHAEHADQWQRLQDWLWLAGIDWRTA